MLRHSVTLPRWGNEIPSIGASEATNLPCGSRARDQFAKHVFSGNPVPPKASAENVSIMSRLCYLPLNEPYDSFLLGAFNNRLQYIWRRGRLWPPVCLKLLLKGGGCATQTKRKPSVLRLIQHPPPPSAPGWNQRDQEKQGCSPLGMPVISLMTQRILLRYLLLLIRDFFRRGIAARCATMKSSFYIGKTFLLISARKKLNFDFKSFMKHTYKQNSLYCRLVRGKAEEGSVLERFPKV